MLQVITQKSYEKDLVVCIKRKYEMQKLKDIVQQLANNVTLDPKHRNHKLKGAWKGCGECHITNDWLLVYIKTDTQLILISTGTHSDIFG